MMLVLTIKNITGTFVKADYYFKLIEDGDEAKVVSEGFIRDFKRDQGYAALVERAGWEIGRAGNPKPKDAE